MSESKSSSRKFIIFTLSGVFLIALVAGSIVRVEPDQIGVRSNNFGLFGAKGLVRQDLAPGWHLNIPILHTTTVYPATIRKIELTKDLRQRSALGGEVLLVQSSDGDRVLMDVHVFFRIKPGNAHRLLEDSGPGDGHVHILKNLASEHLRAVFGKMRTEQFYDPVVRHEKTVLALASLSQAMEARFIEVIDIAVQDIEFEPKYEQKIREKKLADQNVELQKAEARVAAERFKVDAIKIETANSIALLQAETRAEIDRINAEANKEATTLRADSRLYAEQQRAQGQIAMAAASAQITQAKNEALAGSGGKNLAALEAVRNLKITSLTFPTAGRDWFDVEEMARRLGARAD